MGHISICATLMMLIYFRKHKREKEEKGLH